MMKKKTGWILAAICLFFAFPQMVCAANTEYVVDQADLLTDEEETVLSEKAQAMAETWKQDFVLVTTDDAEGKEAEAYADDYYDYNGYQKNGVLYLIDLDNGEIWISTSGAMIRFLTDERIEKVLDAGYSEVKGQNYEEGLLLMLDQTEAYMDSGIPDGQYTYDRETGKIERHRSVTFMEGLIAVVIALVCGGGFAMVTISSYKMKKSSYKYPYREKARVDFTRREDRFINQIVTQRRIPKSPPPGSGGGGGRSSVHTSSSGGSHGGGGRSL